MAGIVGVRTGEEHRKRGYASRVMWAAIEEMARRRYDVSVLFGIEDFYHHYGYSVYFPSTACSVVVEALPASMMSGYRARLAKSGDLPQILRLYRLSNVDRTASTIRPRSWLPRHRLPGDGWRMPRMGGDTVRRPGRAIVVARGKRVVAYAEFDAQDGHCTVSEVGGSPDGYPALTRRIRQIATGVGAVRI